MRLGRIFWPVLLIGGAFAAPYYLLGWGLLTSAGTAGVMGAGYATTATAQKYVRSSQRKNWDNRKKTVGELYAGISSLNKPEIRRQRAAAMQGIANMLRLPAVQQNPALSKELGEIHQALKQSGQALDNAQKLSQQLGQTVSKDPEAGKAQKDQLQTSSDMLQELDQQLKVVQTSAGNVKAMEKKARREMEAALRTKAVADNPEVFEEIQKQQKIAKEALKHSAGKVATEIIDTGATIVGIIADFFRGVRKTYRTILVSEERQAAIQKVAAGGKAVGRAAVVTGKAVGRAGAVTGAAAVEAGRRAKRGIERAQQQHSEDPYYQAPVEKELGESFGDAIKGQLGKWKRKKKK